MKEAIGTIETKGFVTAIAALDGMLKAANVEWVGYKKKLGAGLVTITIRGDVGAVNAAIDTGKKIGGDVGEVVATHIIPRVSRDVAKVFSLNEDELKEVRVVKKVPSDVTQSKTKKEPEPTPKEEVEKKQSVASKKFAMQEPEKTNSKAKPPVKKKEQ